MVGRKQSSTLVPQWAGEGWGCFPKLKVLDHNILAFSTTDHFKAGDLTDIVLLCFRILERKNKFRVLVFFKRRRY